MRLSHHFTLGEATRSQVAARKGIDNTPPPELVPKIQAVAVNILEPPRTHYGFSISPSSWYRSAELCVAIGSSSNSQHAKGEAVDFEITHVDNIELAFWLADNVDYDKLILEFYDHTDPSSGWVHCSYRGRDNRHKTYTITRENGAVITREGLPT